MDVYTVFGLFAGIFIGAAGCWVLARFTARNLVQQAHLEADQIRVNATAEAQNKAKEIELAARQEQLKLKEQFEREARSRPQQARRPTNTPLQARRHARSQARHAVGQGKASGRPGEQARPARQVDWPTRKSSSTDVLREQRDRLLQIAGMSAEQAKEMLLEADRRRMPAGSRRDDPADHRAGPGRGQGKEPA